MRDCGKPRHIPCTIEAYHQRPEWSNSQIGDLVNPDRGPLYFHGAHFCNPPLWTRDAKAHFDLGTIVHTILTSPGTIADVAIEIPEDVLSKSGSKAGAAYRAWEAEHPGRIHIKAQQMAEARRMVANVYNHPKASRLLDAAMHYEHSLVWQDEATGLDLRSRADIVSGFHGSVVVVDLKSTRAMNPREFTWDIRKYGYHRQAAFYSRAWRLLGYDVAGFVFIAVSKTLPYSCRVYSLDTDAIDEGDREIDEALRDLAKRIANHGDRPKTDTTAWLSPLDLEATTISLPPKKES